MWGVTERAAGRVVTGGSKMTRRMLSALAVGAVAMSTSFLAVGGVAGSPPAGAVGPPGFGGGLSGLPGLRTSSSPTTSGSGSTPGGTTSASAAGSSAATANLPVVTEIPPGSGEHGYPYDAAPQQPIIPEAPSIDLTADGYAEEEFLMSGTTDVYRQSGPWSSNGDWNVSVSQSGVPYTTRLLVRYPTNPAEFNGTVVVEWLNDTTGGDQDPVWSELYDELVDNGYAYVGVTAQTAGMADLKTWDPVRYGSLGDSNDGQSYDIFTQAAEAVRADSATLLGGLTPKEIIGTGDSQSAFRVDTYVNAIQPISHAYNGFMAVGRAAVDAPIGSGLLATGPFPSLVRTTDTVPFLQIYTQGDVEELDAGVASQPDSADLRTWDVSGASHIDNHEAAYELETVYREQPSIPIPECSMGTPVEGTGTILDGTNQADDMPLYEVEDAGIAALQKWITQGVAPAEPTPLSAASIFGLYDLVSTDQYGLASGGIQLPEAQVPTQDYSPINFEVGTSTSTNPLSLLSELEELLGLLATGSIPITDTEARDEGLCLLSGYFTDLSSSALTSLYPTHADYVAKYTAAVDADEAEGYLTPADGAAAIAAAEASSIP